MQACRGEKLDPGVMLRQRKEKRTETDSIQAAYKIPTQADFLIAYSSVEGTQFSFWLLYNDRPLIYLCNKTCYYTQCKKGGAFTHFCFEN